MGKADSDATDARAQWLAPCRSERVQVIAELMARNEWHRGKTGRELAEEWGLRETTVKRDAAVASTLVKQTYSDEELRAHVSEFLSRNAGLAQIDRQYGAAAQSLRTLLEARGMLREQVDLTVRGDLSALSHKELKELAQAAKQREDDD